MKHIALARAVLNNSVANGAAGTSALPPFKAQKNSAAHRAPCGR